MSESRACRGHKGVSDSLELQLERVVSCPMRMLEFELRSSARSGVLTLGATSPVLYLLLLTPFYSPRAQGKANRNDPRDG